MMRMSGEEAVGRSGKMRPPGKAECSHHICGWQGKQMNQKLEKSYMLSEKIATLNLCPNLSDPIF